MTKSFGINLIKLKIIVQLILKLIIISLGGSWEYKLINKSDL